MIAQTTEPGSSLEEAGSAIAGLLSGKPEDPQKRETQPEPVPSKESTQAPAEQGESDVTDSAEIEPADPVETPETDVTPLRLFKVKVDGQELEVPEDEVLKGYSRTEDYTRKTQQLAAERKAFQEQEVAAVRAERHQYGQYLEQLKTALTNLTPVEPDWAKLRAEVTPEVFAAELLGWQQTQKQLASVAAESARVTAAEHADADSGFQRYVQEQQGKLAEAIPAMKDPEKAATLKTDLKVFAASRGFSEDELASVTDHRMIVLLHDAMQHQTAKSKAPAIANKIEKALEVSAPGSRTTAPKTSELAAAKARLKQSHSAEDAGAAITALFKQKV